MVIKLTKVLMLLAILAMPFTIFAQRPGGGQRGGQGGGMKGMVKGKVVDANTQAPLEYATISIFSQKDSAIVTGDITNTSGVFEIETPPGRYFAKVDFIGFKALQLENFSIGKDSRIIDLGIIKLGANSEILNEIEVRAEKSSVQMGLDKRIFNVGKDLANNGGSAADILDNVPSVAVDIDGNVSLRGSEGVQILVDGKPSGLVGIGSTGGLKALPANLIDKVEVITNPSAKFEAEGTSGIINIVLKKEKKSGLNGSFDFTLGIPDIYGVAFNLNYRRKNLNFFTNIGVNHRKNIGGGTSHQRFFSNSKITNQIRDHERGGLSGNIRFGADYYFNPKNTLTTSFLYRVSRDDNFSEIFYNDFFETESNPIGTTYRTDNEDEDETKSEFALTYTKKFNKKNHELVADVRYQDNTEEEKSLFEETYFDADSNPTTQQALLQRSGNEEGERRIITKLDYTLPLGKKEKFEAGYQGSFRNINNDYAVEEEVNGEYQALPNLTNEFNYDEYIYGIYATYGNKINKFSYQVGVRMEHSDVRTELVNNDSINARTYTNLFPSGFISYELNNGNSIQASYSRRVRRPRFWSLNPFFTFSDARNQFSGNPNLDPEFTDSYEIGHVKYWEKGSLSSAIFYRHTTDVITRIITSSSADTTFRRPVNLATENNIGLEFTFSYNPTKWLRFNGDVNLFRSITEGENEGVSYDADTYTSRGRLTSRVTVKKKTDIQLRFNYRAPRETTQGSTKAIAFIDLGISRDILKNNGTLTFNASDPFQTRRRRGITETENFYREDDFQWRGRTFRLTLNYRLNQKKRRGGGRRGGDYGGGEEF